MHYHIQSQLFNMLSGKTPRKRLIIETPPQHYKSTIISQIFPAWLLLSKPELKLILLSYDANLVEGHSRVARDMILEHGKYLTGVEVAPDSQSKSHWHTTKGGYLKACSIMGGVTGRPADGIIIDDPFKGSEDADSPTMRDKIFQQFSSVAETRLHPNGFIIIVNTRWHLDDLCGRLLEHEPDKWTRLTLPAIAGENDQLGRNIGEPLLPERYPISWYQERKDQYESRGLSHMWDALYNCNPTSTSSEWTEYLTDSIWCHPDTLPNTEHTRMRCLSLDPSMGKSDTVGDYSAFTDVTLDHTNHLYVRSHVQRCPADQVIQLAVNLLKNNHYDCFIVETNMMQSLFADAILKACQVENINCPILHHDNKEDKVVRIRMSLTPLLAQRRIHLSTDSPSNRILLKQLKEFPTGQYDDSADSLQLATVAINHLLNGRKQQPQKLIYKV